jgi:hypothetical protein
MSRWKIQIIENTHQHISHWLLSQSSFFATLALQYEKRFAEGYLMTQKELLNCNCNLR